MPSLGQGLHFLHSGREREEVGECEHWAKWKVPTNSYMEGDTSGDECRKCDGGKEGKEEVSSAVKGELSGSCTMLVILRILCLHCNMINYKLPYRGMTGIRVGAAAISIQSTLFTTYQNHLTRKYAALHKHILQSSQEVGNKF